MADPCQTRSRSDVTAQLLEVGYARPHCNSFVSLSPSFFLVAALSLNPPLEGLSHEFSFSQQTLLGVPLAVVLLMGNHVCLFVV